MEARSGFDDDGTMEDAMAEQDELESRFCNFRFHYELEDVQVMSALALQESRERRETKLQVEIESVVECPVCYTIPRQLPIPCCPAGKERPNTLSTHIHQHDPQPPGHILCQVCRARVLHCPTCRRQLEDNTSSLAAALIEKNFHQHAVRNQCSVAIRRPTKFNLSKGWLRWDGTSLRKNEEFNLREDLAWSFFHTVQFDNNFYFSAQYFAAEQLFLFYVMVMGGVDLAEQFTAHIALTSKENRVRLMFSGPLLPLDRVPATEEALMASTSCFTVHYRAMRPLLSVTEVGENRNVCWSVDFLAEVDLVRKTEEGLSPMIQ